MYILYIYYNIYILSNIYIILYVLMFALSHFHLFAFIFTLIFSFNFTFTFISIARMQWLKLNKYDHSTGRAFGNSLDEKTLGGRSLFLHNVLYSEDRNMQVPPATFDPAWTGVHGRVGATSGHLYDSDVAPPSLHEWKQYVVVYEESEVLVYNNGILASREATFGDGDGGTVATLGSSDFVIGNHEFKHKEGKFKLSAYVGLVRVWKEALSPSEIYALFEHSQKRFGVL